jgi:hypothetical protein
MTPSEVVPGTIAPPDLPLELTPRSHHYDFTHRILPQLTFENPARMREFVRERDAEGRLRKMWHEYGDTVRKSGGIVIPGAPELAVHDGKGDLVAVVRMPSPARVAECHFVALHFQIGGRGWKAMLRRLRVRYFTLEVDDVPRGAPPRTLLGGWHEGTHVSFGEGPPPSQEAFLAAVRAQVEAQGA